MTKFHLRWRTSERPDRCSPVCLSTGVRSNIYPSQCEAMRSKDSCACRRACRVTQSRPILAEPSGKRAPLARLVVAVSASSCPGQKIGAVGAIRRYRQPVHAVFTMRCMWQSGSANCCGRSSGLPSAPSLPLSPMQGDPQPASAAASKKFHQPTPASLHRSTS